MKKLLLVVALFSFLGASYAVNSMDASADSIVLCEDNKDCDKKDCDKKTCDKTKAKAKTCTAAKAKCCSKTKAKTCDKSKAADKEKE